VNIAGENGATRAERLDVSGELYGVLEEQPGGPVGVDLRSCVRDQAGEPVGVVRRDHLVAVAVGDEDRMPDDADALAPQREIRS
jgi:hypothetical protein